MGENADKKTYRYYSTERPLMPGCCPRAGVFEKISRRILVTSVVS